MAWKIELTPAADRELDKLDPQVGRRILRFLHQRIATLDDPRRLGEALQGDDLGGYWKYRRSMLDNYDKRILDILQQDGRISNQELADRIGLSPSPCLRRVRALEEAGIIEGYRALLSAKALGLNLIAFLSIAMDRHTPERFANFDAQVAAMPEVLECFLITGRDADYQLKVIVRDMDAYQDLLLNKLTRIEGVSGVHSSFVLRRVVERTTLPVG